MISLTFFRDEAARCNFTTMDLKAVRNSLSDNAFMIGFTGFTGGDGGINDDVCVVSVGGIESPWESGLGGGGGSGVAPEEDLFACACEVEVLLDGAPEGIED
jgi:hypothetical protein